MAGVDLKFRFPILLPEIKILHSNIQGVPAFSSLENSVLQNFLGSSLLIFAIIKQIS